MVAAPAAAGAATAVAWLAWRARTLTNGGAAAAAAVGTAVLWGTGVAGGLVLLAFFVPVAVLERVVRGRTAAAPEPAGDCRNQWQVLANGGVAALGALAGRADPVLGLWLATGAFAAAGADTWATIWGARSPAPPRHLLSGRRVPHGTSGAVSGHGTAGAVAGAAVVAAAGAVFGGGPALLAAGTAAGTAGMLADSLLGASLQGRWHCPACDAACEQPVHRCGTRARPAGGVPWLTNDGVNALATVCGALLALAAWRWR